MTYACSIIHHTTCVYCKLHRFFRTVSITLSHWNEDSFGWVIFARNAKRSGRCTECSECLWYHRWTKYSNPEEKIGMTPPSPNVNVKQSVRDMSCWRVRFLLSTRVNPWKKKTTLKFEGRVKFSRVWMFCPSTVGQRLSWTGPYHARRSICDWWMCLGCHDVHDFVFGMNVNDFLVEIHAL